MGVVLYSGILMLYFGINDFMTFSSAPKNFDDLSAADYIEGTRVHARIYQVGAKIAYSRTEEKQFFGMSIGKPTRIEYFLIPLKYEENLKDMRYILIAVNSDDSETLERLKVLSADQLRERSENDEIFDFTGIVYKSTTEELQSAVTELMNNYGLTGAGIDFGAGYTAFSGAENYFQYYLNHVVRYTLYADYRTKETHISALIAGGVLTLGSVTAIILGISKIHRRKEYY